MVGLYCMPPCWHVLLNDNDAYCSMYQADPLMDPIPLFKLSIKNMYHKYSSTQLLGAWQLAGHANRTVPRRRAPMGDCMHPFRSMQASHDVMCNCTMDATHSPSTPEVTLLASVGA